MTTKTLASIILSIAIVTTSFAAKPKSVIVLGTREIAILAPYHIIVVDQGIDVVLVQDPYRLTVTVSGDEKIVPYIHTSIENNTLRVSSKKRLQGKKITVYIPVANVSLIDLAAGSSVSGEGTLKFPDLSVFVSTDSRVELNIVGNIAIKSKDNCNLVFEKHEKYKLIPSVL